ncbi:MAG TPA: hypothetical protein VND20_01015 [Candidatus Binataceae bacterium]|nr:hypothetical protein [Candidatus Binataceae bacterium]
MRLCIGTSKGIVIVDPDRAARPLMVLADPASVWCLAQDSRDPHLLYAGAIQNLQAGSARGRSALARSHDGGRNWTDITPGAARDEDVWSIAVPPDRPGELIIGTNHARLLRSLNGGQSFRECAVLRKFPDRERKPSAAGPHPAPVRALSFAPGDSSVIYAGVEDGGVFRSPDGGATFVPLDHAVHTGIHGLAVDPDEPKRLYVATARGAYRSEDRGASWSYLKGLGRNYAVAILASGTARGGGVMIAAAGAPPALWPMSLPGADAMVFESLDHGDSFAPYAAPDGIVHPARGLPMRLLANPLDPAVIFGAVSDGSLIRVDRRTATVRTITENLPPAYDLAAIP